MLFDRCHTESCALLRRSPAAYEAANQYQPWRSGNRDTTALGWARYYTALRKESAGLNVERDPAAIEAESSARRLLDALMDASVVVDEFIGVHAKSIDSLWFIAGLGRRLSEVSKERLDIMRVAESGSLRDLESALAGPDAELTSLLGLIGWAATHPGPALPFDVAITDANDLPRLPLYVQALGIDTLGRIFTGLSRLHDQRMGFLRSLMPNESGHAGSTFEADPASWMPLIRSLSEQLELPPATLFRDWSLPCLLGLAVVAGEMGDAPPGLASLALVS